MDFTIVAYYEVRGNEPRFLNKFTDLKGRVSDILTRPDRHMCMWRSYISEENPTHKWVPVIKTARHVMNTFFLEGGIKVTLYTDDMCRALFKFDNISGKEQKLLAELEQSGCNCIEIQLP